MRVSRLMLVTLRDDPSEAEIPSHKLLLRAGYIRRVASGIYAYLPLMWRVLQKVSRVVREEMDGTGALETLLPQLQPAELWQRSGRWAGYTAGEGIMFLVAAQLQLIMVIQLRRPHQKQELSMTATELLSPLL